MHHIILDRASNVVQSACVSDPQDFHPNLYFGTLIVNAINSSDMIGPI
jgi:hypothetical protein